MQRTTLGFTQLYELQCQRYLAQFERSLQCTVYDDKHQVMKPKKNKLVLEFLGKMKKIYESEGDKFDVDIKMVRSDKVKAKKGVRVTQLAHKSLAEHIANEKPQATVTCIIGKEEAKIPPNHPHDNLLRDEQHYSGSSGFQ